MGTGRTRTGAESLWIVGVGGVDRSVLETVAEGAAETIPVNTRIHPDIVSLSGFDGVESEGLFQGLDLADYAQERSGRERVLVVTDADIAKPRGERAFGLAWRRGSTGIVSTARLGDRDAAGFDRRLRTVTSQHVGYLVGMGACDDTECLFHVADRPGDFDRIGPDPCESCRDDLLGRSSPLLPDDDWSLAAVTSGGRDGAAGPGVSLSVVGLGDPDADALKAAADAVGTHLSFDATVAGVSLTLNDPPSVAYDPDRDQYDATKIVEALQERADDEPVLVVTDADLFARRNNYVFGVGIVAGSVALFSTARLATDTGLTTDSSADTSTVARVRKQAVKQAGRLLGAGACDTKRCVFCQTPTVRELDVTAEAPCGDCASTLADRSWPVSEAEIRAERGADESDDGTDSGASDAAGGADTDADPEPPEEQGRIEYLWRGLVHDLTNAASFWGFVAGFGLSVLVAFLALGSAVEFVLGPLGQQPDQVTWVLFAVSLLVGWELYKLLKWVVLSMGRTVVGGLRSATE